jgi:hypothetical protein
MARDQKALPKGSETMAAALVAPVSLIPMVTEAVAVLRVTTVVVELTPEPEPDPVPDPEPLPLPLPLPLPDPEEPGVMVVQLTMVVQETMGVTVTVGWGVGQAQ